MRRTCEAQNLGRCFFQQHLQLRQLHEYLRGLWTRRCHCSSRSQPFVDAPSRAGKRFIIKCCDKFLKQGRHAALKALHAAQIETKRWVTSLALTAEMCSLIAFVSQERGVAVQQCH